VFIIDERRREAAVKKNGTKQKKIVLKKSRGKTQLVELWGDPRPKKGRGWKRRGFVRKDSTPARPLTKIFTRRARGGKEKSQVGQEVGDKG